MKPNDRRAEDGPADSSGPEGRPATVLAGLTFDDPATFSISELEDRIGRLQAEIERCRDLIDAKQGARADADAIFKS